MQIELSEIELRLTRDAAAAGRSTEWVAARLRAAEAARKAGL
nr:hypothetical protein [uncultured Rhodopila sp.]